MKKRLLRLMPIFIFLVTGGWLANGYLQPQPASAQGESLNAILARAAVKGYLTSLRLTSDSSILTDFYLTASANSSDVAQSLSQNPVASFDLVQESWVNNETFQTTAVLNPDSRVVVAEVIQVNSRWKINQLDWGDSAAADLVSTNNNTNPALFPVGTSSSSGTAEVLAFQLNVRSGPGTVYPATDVLDQGDTVDIVGINATQEWYEVAQGGETIGWISASPQFVSSSGALQTNLPVVPAPGVPFSGGTLILQTSSGGPIYRVSEDGTDVTYLTTGIDPALSPDSTKLAFTRWDSGEVGSLWIYDLNTGSERHVAGEILEAKSPTWSSDGDQIVVSLQEGGRRVEKQDCIRLGTRRPPAGAFDFRVRGENLCFKLPPDTHWRLRMINVADGSYEDLASATYSYAPTWDPVNDWRVVFAGQRGLQQLDLNRNEYFPFTEDVRDHAPVFAPDGSAVAVTYREHNVWQVHKISTATGERIGLTRSSVLDDRPINNAAPAWSPDSSQIAFVSDRSGEWEFWVMNADGSNPRPLLSDSVASELDVQYNAVDERLINWGQ